MTIPKPDVENSGNERNDDNNSSYSKFFEKVLSEYGRLVDLMKRVDHRADHKFQPKQGDVSNFFLCKFFCVQLAVILVNAIGSDQPE